MDFDLSLRLVPRLGQGLVPGLDWDCPRLGNTRSLCVRWEVFFWRGGVRNTIQDLVKFRVFFQDQRGWVGLRKSFEVWFRVRTERRD